jgi:hypothetical protein
METKVNGKIAGKLTRFEEGQGEYKKVGLYELLGGK